MPAAGFTLTMTTQELRYKLPTLSLRGFEEAVAISGKYQQVPTAFPDRFCLHRRPEVWPPYGTIERICRAGSPLPAAGFALAMTALWNHGFVGDGRLFIAILA